MQALPRVLSIGGNLIKGLGGLAAGNAAKRNAFRQAREEENAGAARSLMIREQARKAIGEQLAAQSANGFEGGTGTALDALLESQTNAVLDAMMARREAEGRAMAYREQGRQAASEGRFALAEGLLGAGRSAFGMQDDWAQARRGVAG